MTEQPNKPITIRLPRTGERCTYTNLSRSSLNQLVLPCRANNFNPPVRSFVLRKPGARTGIRLIELESLINYIKSEEADAKHD